jgi:hypothetical protein
MMLCYLPLTDLKNLPLEAYINSSKMLFLILNNNNKVLLSTWPIPA